MQEKDHVVFVQIDPAIKKEADAVLAAMGLTASDLCRMAITWVAKEKPPSLQYRYPYFRYSQCPDQGNS